MNKRNYNEADSILQQNLQNQKEENINILLGQVNKLKSISIQFGDDIDHDKQENSKLEDQFQKVNVMMQKTLASVDKLFESTSGKVSLSLMLISMLIILSLLYYIKSTPK